MSNTQKWYVVHTYSGYENKVKANIEKIIDNRKLHDQITEVIVPLQDVVEVKNGAKKQVKKKLFPGYVLLKMDMNDDTWYVVRNTRGVTGFVGPGSKPVPLTEDEIRALGIRFEVVQIDIAVGDMVRITTGPFEGSVGEAKDVNNHKKTVTVNLSVFGRETPVELNFTEIQRM
ncbi:transcription antitermination protein nusG [Natranaerovirga hydrolytica]|uniref:Transcription termination/antitermination protein NusG n=1 Tax=Natranaerovirga hydrolytica TaxID=680378 RepID=A0A4R1MKN5_9FIRM|nr:transcription termination/antitermination protein NusG [Natranaerovirga hydrolytica]TCK93398.1 transcription antitermination protein nusG [Natranaerovirga hydrolytica]